MPAGAGCAPAGRADMTGAAILEVHDVGKSFGGFTAVAGVSLTMAAREIVAIIGPNGAGKSTFFNLVTGHIRPDKGEVRFEGRPITHMAPHDICRLGLGRSFQRINIFPRLSVFQNVQAAFIAHRGLGTHLWGRSAELFAEETMALLESIGLAAIAADTSGRLSYGAQKQIDASPSGIAALTQKERAVVVAVIEHKGAPSKVIAAALHISPYTLRNHLSTIYSKLDVRNRMDLLMYAHEHGLHQLLLASLSSAVLHGRTQVRKPPGITQIRSLETTKDTHNDRRGSGQRPVETRNRAERYGTALSRAGGNANL
jgi:ABC-type uncharacterized transport system ATPase subunit